MASSVEQRLAALELEQTHLREQLVNSTAAQAGTVESMNVMWMLHSGMIIFLMQFGFCMLETGSVRSQSTESIMIKNIGDCCFTAIAWWTVGFALTFDSGNGFIGYSTIVDGIHSESRFVSYGLQSSEEWAFFFFHFNFVATATTIVSGAIAERAHITSYFLYSTLCAALIYPPVAHWQWSATGWASPFRADGAGFLGGVIDFAGCGAVHLVGGVGALCGAALIGPRVGRFDQSSKKPIPLLGHSSVLQVMGTFILWAGWYGFNAGSTMRLDGTNARTAARIVATTTLSASAGGLTGLLVPRCLGSTKTWDVPYVCNSVLAGLVSITAGCATLTTWAAFLTGIVGAVAYLGASRTLLRLGIDDPLDASAVHGVCGAWGLLAASLLSTGPYTADAYGPALAPGLFYHADGKRLGAATVFVVATVAWVGATSSAIFMMMKLLGVLRAPDKLDEAEIDLDASILPQSTYAIADLDAADAGSERAEHADTMADASSVLLNEFGLDPSQYLDAEDDEEGGQEGQASFAAEALQSPHGDRGGGAAPSPRGGTVSGGRGGGGDLEAAEGHTELAGIASSNGHSQPSPGGGTRGGDGGR